VVASPATTTAAEPAPTTQTAIDEAARKKAFEDAVRQKLREEMLKLQSEYTRSLQQQQSKSAPVQTASLSAPVQTPLVEEPSAAQLDQQRRESLRALEPAATTTTQAPAPQPQPAAVLTQTTAPAVSTQPPPAVVEAPVVREGDIIDFGELDAPVTVVRTVKPVYPPIAVRQRIEANVLLTALISETGDVLEVKVLRGDPRFGFNDSAMASVRKWKYTGPRKDGKRVRTWVPQIIQFKP
jgi:protein TonB